MSWKTKEREKRWRQKGQEMKMWKGKKGGSEDGREENKWKVCA